MRKSIDFYLSAACCWIRFPDGVNYALRTPLSKALFSERKGYEKPIFKIGMWRIFKWLK